MAFAVIGDTMNCASRLVVSRQLIDAAQASGDPPAWTLTQGLTDHGEIPLKGRGRPLPVFSDAGAKSTGKGFVPVT